MKVVNIAIDGYVGSGKTTLAKGLAQKLGYKFFDTGAIYRGFACEFLNSGLDEKMIDENFVKEFIASLNFEVKFKGDVEHIIINGTDYTASLRECEVSRLSAILAPYESIQNAVKKVQRKFAKHNSCVMEGRDVGFDVLPNADYKFFLTADENVRAKRRYDELISKNKQVSFKNVLKDLRERDYADVHRKVAPLKMAEDAILVDNTNMDLDTALEYCLKIISKTEVN